MPLQQPRPSLAEGCPALALQWHPSLNGIKTPENIRCGSNFRAWWLGPCGHAWDAPVTARVTGGHGCPVCSGRRVLTGFNDLATKSPAVAAEWHPTLNGDRTPGTTGDGTKKKAWWRCRTGHEWEASVVSRTRIDLASGRTGNGCPYCSGRYSVVGVNDLGTTHPGVAAEWHPTFNDSLRPKDVQAGSQRRVWWRGVCGHDYKAKIQHRATFGSGCPFCSGNRVLAGFNDLATTHPEIAAEWHPTLNTLTPQDVSRGSKKKITWLCPFGHTYSCTSNARTNPANLNGCPNCAAARTQEGTSLLEGYVFEAVASVFPDARQGARIERASGGGRGWWLDVLVESQRLVVEYDGQPWHCSCCAPWPVEPGYLEGKDRLKNADLESQGYTVVRVRTPHLRVLSDHDVVVERRVPREVLEGAVVARLREMLADGRLGGRVGGADGGGPGVCR